MTETLCPRCGIRMRKKLNMLYCPQCGKVKKLYGFKNKNKHRDKQTDTS